MALEEIWLTSMKKKRQFKFRVWNQKTDSWLKNEQLFEGYSHWMIDLFNGDVIDAKGYYDGDNHDSRKRKLCFDEGYYIKGVKFLKHSPYIIQQYTGLQDDNGKDIYEGDICQYTYHITHGPHEDGHGVVYWDDEIGGFLFDETSQFNRIELTKCEVIGNIFENEIPKIKTIKNS